MRRAVAIIFAVAMLGASLFYFSSTSQTFDEIYVRNSAVGYRFAAERFFSGPNEIQIQSNGKIRIINPVTNVWIYGQLNDEKIAQVTSKIEKANFRSIKWNSGICDFHTLDLEISVIFGGKRNKHSGCVNSNLPKELSDLSKEIFQIAADFITDSFIELANNGNARAAYELSYKFAPEEFKQTAENIISYESQVKEAYFWAYVAQLNFYPTTTPPPQDTYGLRSNYGLALGNFRTRLAELEQKMDNASLGEMNQRLENWREKHLNKAPLNEGNNK